MDDYIPYISLQHKSLKKDMYYQKEIRTDGIKISVAMGAKKLRVSGNQGVWNGLRYTKTIEIYPTDLVDGLAEIYKWFLTYPKPDTDTSPF